MWSVEVCMYIFTILRSSFFCLLLRNLLVWKKKWKTRQKLKFIELSFLINANKQHEFHKNNKRISKLRFFPLFFFLISEQQNLINTFYVSSTLRSYFKHKVYFSQQNAKVQTLFLICWLPNFKWNFTYMH